MSDEIPTQVLGWWRPQNTKLTLIGGDMTKLLKRQAGEKKVLGHETGAREKGGAEPEA